VPANLPADRLILDYLSRVADASNRYLAKGKRIAFVGTTRKRIEREIGAAGMADPARVREVLARFGDPEELVKAERARQDEERLTRLSRKHETGGDDAAALPAPLLFRSLNSRRKPIAQPRPLRPPPSAGEGDTGQQEPPAARPAAAREGRRKSRFGGLLLGRPDRPGARPGTPPQAVPGTPPPQPAAASPPAGTAGQGTGHAAGRAPGGTVPLTPRGTGTPASGGAAAGDAGTHAPGETRALPPGGSETPPSGAAGAPAPGDAGTQTPGGISPRALSAGPGESAQHPPAAASAGHGAAAGDTSPLSRGGDTLRDVTATLGRGAGRLALGAARMARRSPLETIAILLLGVGGFLYPFPFWLLGGLLALWSRTWNAQDKWIALAGPLAIAFVGTLVTALIIGGLSHAVPMYPHAFRVSVGYLLRAGCVICAVYLAMQARRGPQRRLPPWKR